MTDYVAKVLRIAPSTWLPCNYINKNYLTVELENSSTEYENIVTVLRDTHDSLADRIRCIQRVQHPFAYGRFLLRKEQLEKRENKKYVPSRYFLQVKESQIKDALAFNIDKRRTPFDCYCRRTDSDKCVVVVQSIREPAHWKMHSESYPEYVVFYNLVEPETPILTLSTNMTQI